MRFDIYIFDLDGTLLNLGNVGAYADQNLIDTLKSLQVPDIPSKEERQKFFSSHNYIQVLENWNILNPEKFWHNYDKVDYEKRKTLISKKKLTLFHDVKEVLESIFNHDDSKIIAIVTNTADFVVEFVLKKFDIFHYFREIFSLGKEVSQDHAKPSPNGINLILKKNGYDPKHDKALMIGDSIVDIMAAKKANIFSCLINRPINNNVKNLYSWKYQPDYVIEDLHELLEL
ncbi:MAG: HAD family hydrolase [Promethearchaeota archaeon]